MDNAEYINGVKFVTEDNSLSLLDSKSIQKRLDICNGCVFKIKHQSEDMCDQCGCLVKVKTAYRENICPIGKW